MSSSSSPLTPDPILQTAFSFWSSKVLLTAVEFGGLHPARERSDALADRGKTLLTTLLVHGLLAACFLAADAVVAAGSVIAFAVTAFLIDSAVQLNQITSQKIIFEISDEARGRIN